MIEYSMNFDRSTPCAKIEHFNFWSNTDEDFQDYPRYVHNRQYIAAIDTERNLVVGLLCYVPRSSWDPDFMGLGFVSVAQDYKNQKIASNLLSMWVSLAASENKGIRMGHYEPEGLKWLPSVVSKLSVQHNVPLYSTECA